jgi:cytochrome c peroxidase
VAGGLVARADNDGGSSNTGERLFLETRFSQFFFTNSGGNANFVLTNGDPVMDTTASIYGPLPGPFAGRAMNCRACHLVQEHEDVGNRTYADFAPRTPIPANGDGRTRTVRNSLDLVDSLLPHSTPLFLHGDGQFATPEDLVIATLTGRNFGWKPSEYAAARAQIVKIIREDDGTGSLAQQYGGLSYARALAGGTQIPAPYRIVPIYILYDVTVTNTADPNYVSDDRIINDVAALIHAYMDTLVFSQDLQGLFNGSPYDVFLMKNGLPREPALGETPIEYSRRLLYQVSNLPNPQFVSDPADGHFVTHNQRFQFGANELEGMKIFFSEAKLTNAPQGRIGNCVACHAPPAFTDFLFHNTGAAQEEYDSIHGIGAFMSLAVPGFSERQTNYDAFLPATPEHPNALGTFESIPSLDHAGETDLGLWNVFLNPDFPAPQPGLQQILPLLMPTSAPMISFARREGDSLILSGGNGTPGWSFYIVSSTNMALPPDRWTIISTNAFDSAGNFSVTNPISPDSIGFFRLKAGPPGPDLALPRTIGLFKTPDVRDISSSEPYLHTGRMNTLQDMIAFYQTVSAQARAGTLRNPDPALSGISLDSSAVNPLVAFLRALNEDYQDIPCPCL